MEVSVSEPEKRTGTSSVAMQDTYTVYLVETKYVLKLDSTLQLLVI